MLDSLIPNPHIHAFIGPAHHTVPVPLIVEIVALILVTGLPVEDAETVFFVVFIHTFVRVALSLAIFVSLLLLPFPVAVFETVDELAGVATSILPFVLSETFGLSIAVLANVAVTVREEVRPVALTETLKPLSFILVTVGEDMDAVSLRLRVHPLTDVGLSIGALPDAVPVLDPFQPLSIVDFSIFPLVNTLAIGFTVFVGAVVRITICKHFETAPMSLVLEPLALVNSPIHVDEHSDALSLPLLIQLASVDAVFVLLDTKIVTLAYFIVIEFIADHFILLHSVTVVLKLSIVFARRSESLL